MKNEMPLEDRFCTLEQAKDLAEILGKDAPGSYFVWVVPEEEDANPFLWMADFFERERALLRARKPKALYPAYSGDELGVLLKNADKWKKYPCHYLPREKAAFAIEGLTEGWIKPEDFCY